MWKRRKCCTARLAVISGFLAVTVGAGSSGDEAYEKVTDLEKSVQRRSLSLNDLMASESSGEPKPNIANFYIGLTLAILSTVFIGASFIIKKVALQRLAARGVRASDGGYAYLKDWLWWLGLLAMAGGEIANFVAFAFAPATIVTPMGALSIVVSASLGSYFLGENVNLHGKIGSVLTILGSIIMAVSSPKEAEVRSLVDMEAAVVRPQFLLYVVLAIALSMYMIFVVEPQRGRTNIFVYISICAVIGGFSVSCVKGVGIMIRQFLSTGKDHLNIFVEPFAYMLVLSLIMSITTQLNYLNRSLDVFDASMVTPIYFVLHTTSVLICSTILFGELGMLNRPTDGITLLSGFGVIIVGVFMLHSFKHLNITFAEVRDMLRAAEERRQSEIASQAGSNRTGPPSRAGHTNHGQYTLDDENRLLNNNSHRSSRSSQDADHTRISDSKKADDTLLPKSRSQSQAHQPEPQFMSH